MSLTPEISSTKDEIMPALDEMDKELVEFTSHFWQELNQLLGVKLKMSSAYHPETDGSTERANRMVTQMIRIALVRIRKIGYRNCLQLSL